MPEATDEEKLNKEKSRVIVLSVAANAALVAMKIAIGVMTGLVSVIAEALHSANDLVASSIAYFGVKGAMKPPDKEHPYGHGKIEMLTGWIENLFILAIGVGIIYEGVLKNSTHRSTPGRLWLGIGIMLVSGVVNWVVSIYMIKKGKDLRSVGIEVDGQNPTPTSLFPSSSRQRSCCSN